MNTSMSTDMSMGMGKERIIAIVSRFEGALVVAPAAGDDFPELTWGDAFFYYAPDGRMPQKVQPYATVVTKNYPADDASVLDAPDRHRLNIHVDRTTFRDLTGEDPRTLTLPRDQTATDTVLPHPVHGAQGWIAIVNPARRSAGLVSRLLRDAHEAARARSVRRG
ncbi:DUF6194 family protein [Streptomyces sp. NPDC051561]|uniref:DUF6194 family protein n=1 Tax=Streptomyces sp. NPDC051561 TaxID=3365658 RepID=UPI0037927F82